MLSVDGISVSYGASQVLFGVSLAIARRGGGAARPERHGKTTTIKAVVGALSPSTGTVTLDGEPLVGLPAIASASAGSVTCRRGAASSTT